MRTAPVRGQTAPRMASTMNPTRRAFLHVGAGYNVCIFAYGQTGSGKTHTMLGTDVELAEGRGINFRALEDLFDLGRQRQGEARPMPPSAFPGVVTAACRPLPCKTPMHEQAPEVEAPAWMGSQHLHPRSSGLTLAAACGRCALISQRCK